MVPLLMLTVFLTGIRFYAILNVKSLKLKCYLLYLPDEILEKESIICSLFQDEGDSYDKN